MNVRIIFFIICRYRKLAKSWKNFYKKIENFTTCYNINILNTLWEKSKCYFHWTFALKKKDLFVSLKGKWIILKWNSEMCKRYIMLLWSRFNCFRLYLYCSVHVSHKQCRSVLELNFYFCLYMSWCFKNDF